MLTDEQAWRRYLFERNSPDQLAGWTRRLRWFRFCRAQGGHANDGDQLLVSLRYADEDDLFDLCRVLGVTLNRLPADRPRPEPGVAYTAAQWSTFHSEVRAMPHLEQPGWCTIAELPAFVWVESDRLNIHLHDPDDIWSVTESAVRNAEVIEGLLVPLADRVIDRPRSGRHCVTPTTYPELFESGSHVTNL